MATAAVAPSALDSKLSKGGLGKTGTLIFGIILLAGVSYTGYSLASDLT